MKMRKSAGRLLGAASAGCAALLGSQKVASAATFKWDGGASTVSWADSANWDNNGANGLPGAGDTVLFDNTFINPIPTTAIVNNQLIGALTFNSANTIDVRTNLGSTTGTKTLSLTGDGSASNILLSAQGGGTFSTTSNNINGTGSSTMNITTSASGTMSVATGTTLNINNGNSVQIASGATVTVTGGGLLVFGGTGGGFNSGSTLVLNQGTFRANGSTMAGNMNLGSAGGATFTSFSNGTNQSYGGQVTLHDNITFGGSTFVGMAFTGPVTLTNNVVINAAMNAGNSTLSFSNGFDDGVNTFGFIKTGGSTMLMSGNALYGGGTTVAAGNLNVTGTLLSTANVAVIGGTMNIDTTANLNTNVTNPINGSATLSLGGGTLNVLGKSTGSVSQTFGNVDFVAGAATVKLVPTGTGVLNVTLGNTWTRSAGATVLFDITTSGAKTITSSPTLSNGIIAYALVNDGTVGFATVSGGTLARYTGAASFSGSTDANTNYTTNAVGYSSILSQEVNSLEFTNATAGSFSFGPTLTITSGALLQRGTGSVSIGGGQLGATGSEVIFHQRSAAATTISSLISGGNGMFTKSGPGTIVLTGNNVYTGTTYVTGGTLQIGAGGTAGTVSGGVFLSNGANFTIARSNDMTFANTISGVGSLTKSNTASILTLTAGNSYSGGTVILGGTLVIDNDTAIGTGPLTMGNGGITTVTSTAARTFAGALIISPVASGTAVIAANSGELTFAGGVGTGNQGVRTLQVDAARMNAGTFIANGITNAVFNKTGNGALVITGNNDFNGVQSISAGTLAVAGSLGTLARQTLNGGVLGTNGTFSRSLGTAATNIAWTGSGGFAAFGSNATWGNSANNLTVNIGGSGATFNWNDLNFLATGQSLMLGSAVSNGTVTFANGLGLGSAQRTIDVTRSNTAPATGIDAVISGQIGGSTGSLLKTGTGVLALTTTNTFNGGVSVAAGTLLANANGATGGSNIGVAAAGKLGGTGTISGSVLVRGTLAPGASIGTLTTGALNLDAGGQFAVEVNTTSNTADKLIATGDVSLVDGSTLDLAISGNVAGNYGGSFVIVQLGDGLTRTGNFAGGTLEGDIQTFNAGAVSYTLNYGYNAETLATSGGNDVLLTFSSVPEPSSLGLLLGGGAMFLRRRRRA